MHHPPLLDMLIISELPLWPLDRGFRVHGVNMAKALRGLGMRVGLSTMTEPEQKMPGELEQMHIAWPTADAVDTKRFGLGWSGRLMGLRCKLAEHQDLGGPQMAGLLTLVERTRPAAVIAVGQHGPMLLRGLAWAYPNLPRLWYAADEPVSFQLSMLRREGLRGLRKRARLAAVFGLMQMCFNRGNIAHRLTSAIGVSPGDTRRLGMVGGCKALTIRNGVDTDYYRPDNCHRIPRSCVFWGDLAFEPNVDAATWFAKNVWQQLVYRWPDASWTIIGRRPCQAVRELADLPGVELIPDVQDLRPQVRASSAVVLPMRAGHGIKNKLLEAAAMGMPILASPRAVHGLQFGEGRPPMMVCRGASDWAESLNSVWHNPAQAGAMGGLARQWVMQYHAWSHAAQQLSSHLQSIAPDQPIYVPSGERLLSRLETQQSTEQPSVRREAA